MQKPETNWTGPRHSRRLLLVLFVLAAFFAVQTASAVEILPHQHGGSHHHCCIGCHADHAPALQPAAKVQLTRLAATGWRKLRDEVLLTSDPGSAFNASRAPPA